MIMIDSTTVEDERNNIVFTDGSRTAKLGKAIDK